MHRDGFLKRRAFAGTSVTKSVDDVVAPPRANYCAFRQALLKLTPGDYMCKLFCRGDRCKYCNPAFMAEMEQAVPGLYST
uniref:Uncharacterized protein n=1 Tax=Romanomermis culicivorax TaxID=13658 RepID=A0A915JRY0_ROMCU